MATLINKATQAIVKLLPTHVFGRQLESCNTLLTNMDASRCHANISWDGESWKLRDTSSNGTFINGQRTPVNCYHKLVTGDQIQFGSRTAETWQLLNLDNPISTLLPLQPDLPRLELSCMIALPSDDDPQITLLESLDGHWLCETDSGVAVLKSGDLVGVKNAIWRFIEAKPSLVTLCDETALPLPEEIPSLEFNVSQNEEHVSLKIVYGDRKANLGERSHHYLLLTLARKRMEDAKKGIYPAEQGWYNKDDLCRMLGLEINHINIQLFRFRKQLTDLLPQAPAILQIIESRLGQVRLNEASITVVGGQTFLSLVSSS